MCARDCLVSPSSYFLFFYIHYKRYCDEECQRIDWTARHHPILCQRVSDMKASNRWTSAAVVRVLDGDAE